jgi:hypothetical protein
MLRSSAPVASLCRSSATGSLRAAVWGGRFLPSSRARGAASPACFSLSSVLSGDDTAPLRRLSQPGGAIQIPALGAGSSDGIIYEPAERADNIFGAVVKGGRRLVMFDAETCLHQIKADTAASAAPSLRPRLPWEKLALSKIISSQKVQREQLVVAAAFLGADAPQLSEKLQAFLQELEEQNTKGYVDLIVLEFTDSDTKLSDPDMLGLFKAAEDAIDKGLARSYAVHARDWHAFDRFASKNKSETGGGTSLRRVFKNLRECAQARNGKDKADSHRCVAICCPASLYSPGIFLPTAADDQGKQWSVSELAGRLGLASIVTAPLECLLPGEELENRISQQEEERLKQAAQANNVSVYPPQRANQDRRSSSSPRSPASSGPRPFRCVDTPLHRDCHPRRVAPLLNDIVNFAIHCELMWERQVKDQVREEREKMTSLTSTTASDQQQERGANAGPISDVTNTDQGEGAKKRPVLSVDDLEPTDVCWAQMLVQRLEHPGFLTLLEWQHVRNNRIVPALTRLASVTQGIDSVREFSQCYRGLITELMAKFDIMVEQSHGHQAEWLAREVDQVIRKHQGLPITATTTATGDIDSSASASAISWARKPAPPLHALVRKLFLAYPNAILVSEVPELHELRTKTSRKVDVESEASNVVVEEGAATTATAAKERSETAAADDEEMPVTVETAHKVLAEIVKTQLVMRAATRPLPDWEDPMKDVPVQAELAPLQESMRRMMRASAGLSHEEEGDGEQEKEEEVVLSHDRDRRELK